MKKHKRKKKNSFHHKVKKSYSIFQKALDSVSKHPVVATLTIILSILAAAFTIAIYFYTKDYQPLDLLKADLTKSIINIRLKVVDISEGCKNENTYSQSLEKNNADRLDLIAELAGIADAGNIEKTLGIRARDQVKCFIIYNDTLSLRHHICDGPFFSETYMKQWEKEILHDVNNKSNKKFICPYEVK